MQKIVKEFHRIFDHKLEVLRVKPVSFELSNPTILMLHEGLGSVTMWKDFPIALAKSADCEVIAYSRVGYGKSSAAVLPRKPDYMHIEALQILPALIETLKLENPVLLGHSDGASIAIICAGGTNTALSGLILVAPHIDVEPMAIESITAIKSEWLTGDLRNRLAQHHDDVEAVFEGWNNIWLHEDFINWNIEEYLPGIDVPVLAIQGYDDEYSSMAQIDVIKRAVPDTELLKMQNCRHSPHRDQPQKMLDSIRQFLADLPD
jgi:pimeloyl-ACP methyl ester carboxylesterase